MSSLGRSRRPQPQPERKQPERRMLHSSLGGPLLASSDLSMMQPTGETSDELAIIDELIKEDGFGEEPGSARASVNGPAKLIPRSTNFTATDEMQRAGGLSLLQNRLEPFGVSAPPVPSSPQDSFPSQLSQSLNNLSLRSQLISRGLPPLPLPPSQDLDAPWPDPGPSGGPRGAPEPLEDAMRDPPELVIIEQPKQRGMRFRYQCEGRSAGSILGEGSSETNKTLPTIELQNFEGIPEVKVTACLVWKDWPYRIHPHSLVGKDCNNGLCEVILKPRINARHSFNNLGIQCVKKKDIEEAIEKKLQLGIDPFKAGSLKNHQEVDMNVVRICFQASYQDSMGKTWHLNPVLSEAIFDKKSTNTSELKIYRMNKEQGSCTGGEEFYLLCDKVQKEDISVIFRKDAWEGRADFSQADVHRQIAIVFKTPPYQHLDILEPVEVEVYLRRLTDNVSSEPFPFTYLPKDTDTYRVNKKRKQGMPDILEELSGSDPHGIEAKRKKKKPDYLDHFNLTPSVDFSLPSPEDRGFLASMERITLPDLFEEFGRFSGFSPYSGPSLSDMVLPSATNYAERAEQEFLLDAYSVHSGVTVPLALPGDPEPDGVATLVGSSMFPSQYKENEEELEMENTAAV